MFGFVIAAVAAVIFVLVLIFGSKPLTPDEIERLKQDDEAKELASAEGQNAAVSEESEPEKEKGRRVFRDKATEMLVHLMEDGNLAEIEQAVKNGIRLNKTLEDNQTSLMIAVKNNQETAILPLLIQQGIDINAVDDNGQTALMMAVTFNRNPEVVKKLLELGADKTIKDKAGKVAADYIVMNGLLLNTDVPPLLKV